MHTKLTIFSFQLFKTKGQQIKIKKEELEKKIKDLEEKK
jgi:hypothetical protein